MKHRLDPLLRPNSIAVVGASEKEGSVGWTIVHNLLAGKFEGKIYPVNPTRESVLGLTCYPDMDSLPETVDHVAFAVNDSRIESALEAAISHGARAATIMSQLIIPGDTQPLLQQRVECLIADSGMLVCGANAMGFYNGFDGVWMCGFDTRENHLRGGNVSLISHSGAGMCGIVDCDERIDFNLAVSTGQEINVAMHDYMDYAIEVHQTRVIGLFMETTRDPDGMIAVLEKARQRQIPIVAIKVGKTALSARLAESHSGAVAGQDSAYQALFNRYGVQRVSDMDELATALIMFAQPATVGPGGLATIHDSGGERQLLIDLADDLDVPVAEISPQTVQQLESHLDPGLPAVNPLDAWGAGRADSDLIMERCLAALARDPDTSIAAVVHDRAPYGKIYRSYWKYLREARAVSDKPLFLVSNRQGTGADTAVTEMTREGFPVLDGIRTFLTGVNCLLNYRDFCERPPMNLPMLPDEEGKQNFHELATGSSGEADSLEFLARAGLPVVHSTTACNWQDLLTAAKKMGFPVVLKTAVPGIQHKTEQNGVHLNLGDVAALQTAYDDLAVRIGPEVLLTPMIDQTGQEMLLGMTRDPQFGPLVVIGIGGVRVEAVNDVITAIPPFDSDTAMRLIKGLSHSQLFDFDRGAGKPDMQAFCNMVALFSVLVASLEDTVEEIDMNPVIVHPHGCIAVDALVVTSGNGTGDQEDKS